VDAAAAAVVGVVAADAGRNRAGKSGSQIPNPKSQIPNPKAPKGALGFFLAGTPRLSGCVCRLDTY